jgi:class 3 adenylate cyclase/streptogramin lyase
MRNRGGHVLATVVFTDIVDSTTLARELGDARWRVLLDRHHEVVRKALKRYHGKEIDNAGDGFFASFPDQVDAIRCACEISTDVRELGIEVRAGCHVGQAEVIGRKLGGVTIHAGARVMSQAAPSEVLVSAMIKDLVPASGFTFTDRGERHLKGIDGAWRLFAVEAVDGKERPPPLDSEEAARRRGSIQPLPFVERRWGKIAIGAAVLLLVVGAAATYLGRSKPPEPVNVLPRSVVRIDPTTRSVVADVPVAEPAAAPMIFVPSNQVWVLSQRQQVISVIDTNSNSASGPVPVGQGEANVPALHSGMVHAFDGVYVTPIDSPRSIERIDPLRRVADPPPLKTKGRTGDLAFGSGDLWVSVQEGNTGYVEAISPDGHFRCQRRVGNGPTNVAYGQQAVWISEHDYLTVTKVDPATCKTYPVALTGTSGQPTGIGFGFGFVWVSDSFAGVVYKIDPSALRVVDTITVSDPGQGYQSGVVELDGSMWVASPDADTIEQIDPDTNAVVNRIHLPYAPQSLLAANGSLWATVTQFPR